MFNGLFRALQDYGRAFTLARERKLWGYFLVPGLLSLALGVGFIASAWFLSDNIGDWLTRWYTWDRGENLVERIGQVFGGLLVVALGLILYKVLVMILVGPFMSPLSERVEKYLDGYESPKVNPLRLVRDMVRGIRVSIRNLVWELLLTILLLLLGLIPIFSPFTAIAIFLIQAYYAGFGNMDFTLERHFGYRDSIRFVKANKGIAIGNGIGFLLLLMTGIGFFVAPPLGTIAATLSTVETLEG